jgi:cytidylate kinase
MVVAIDGPAGTGKSTIARTIAERADMFYLNSGSFYRAVTWKVLQFGNPEDRQTVIRTARDIRISLRLGHISVDGVEVENLLRADDVDHWVARHSAIPEVRDEVNKRLKETATSMDLVVEGRDMTTVVFPDADVKIYLDASIRTRALRRFAQGTSEMTLQQIEESIRRRDEIDKTKEFGRLQISPDALYLDTSHLTIEQVCEKVVANIHGHDKTSGVTRQL